ncbi:S8 family serine peptidase [Amycolatopsis tucumanensis]|uniref:S8 family serine peptidase n=1 Tax=Amycolatopsis sp. NPDC006125 TaxID=3156730 RepID=UPI001F01018C|nr:S8 family serine peptidase [Amycolatopsis tucumanensis]MCF6422887.1 S8 family serine peptidase [Amycolatopsis tucumanensis]
MRRSSLRRTRLLIAALAVPLIGGAVVLPSASAQPAALSGPATEFTVLASGEQSVAAAEQAIREAGGTVVRTNTAVGLITATAPANGFVQRVSADDAVYGAAKATAIGQAPTGKVAPKRSDVEKEGRQAPKSSGATTGATGTDPLDDQLWGLKSVRSDMSRTVQPGDKRVKVGVIDTGVDGTHPDIAPNFDRGASRNFTRDIPTDPTGAVVDGPCEFRGCVDPADHDDNGHGTHVAGTIAAAADGFGISGVAPNVTLVNLRAGQDSGFFFLQPVVDAITYAGDAGVDVVNMSFYVDPWLYNCASNPADSAEQQLEQRTVTEAMTRAMNYAYRKGVTEVAALGNQHTDLGAPQPDTTSPDYPASSAHPRTIDNATCLSLPVEGPHTIGVSAFGPSGAKADYSNYGLEQISVSAPGGFFRDGFGTDWYRTNENMILSAYPRNVGVAEGTIDADGNVTPDGAAAGVQKAVTKDGRAAYYQFLQGTSMAAPHASGVAALIVSEYGRAGRGGITMSPDTVQRIIEGTAAPIACPVPATVDYLDEGRDDSFTATCQGSPSFNGFYGHGAVDAYAAVTRGAAYLRG